MNVLQIISSSALLGAERVVCELAANSHSKMHVCLINAKASLLEEFDHVLAANGACLHNIPCKSKFLIAAVLRLRDLIRDNEIQVVHSHGYKADAIAYLATLFFNCEVKLIASCHNWMTNTISEKCYKSIDLFLLRRFDSVVAISRDIRDELVASGVKGRVPVVDNGIDLKELKKPGDKSKLRALLGISPGELVVGCVASLTPEKCHSDLIDALFLLRSQKIYLKLILVGDGPCRNELEHKVAVLGLGGSISFLGHRQDARLLYHAFDVFALVSSKEGLPMALLEAMAACVSVVATSVGAIPTVVRSGINGVLVSPGSIHAISSAIGTLAADAGLRSRLASAGLETVTNGYSSDAMCESYDRIYTLVLNQR